MGLLDMFDSPDLMSSLFGIGSANAAEAPPPPASPPPDVMATAPPSFASGSPDPGSLTFADRFGGDQGGWDLQNDATKPKGWSPEPGSTGPDYTQPPGTQTADRSIPVPPPAPVPAPAPVQPPVPPQVAAAPPPAPPPMNPAAGPPSGVTPDGLAQALGIGPQARPIQAPPVDRMRSALAGVGRGLSAVGDIKLGGGTSKGSAFAKGAGATLEGSEGNQRQQEQDQQARQNQTFNQKSQAFKDWIGAEKLGDEKMITQARSRYYESLADMKKNGMAGSNAWQNTPYGKASALETMLDRWENNKRLQLQAKWKASGSTPDEVKSDLDQLGKDKQSERERRSQALGISPTEYKKGTAREDAFDMEKLSPSQRNIMPDGAWYRYKDAADPKADKDGFVYKQRDWLTKPPYEGWQPSQQSAPQQGTQAAAPDPYSVEQQDQSVMAG